MDTKKIDTQKITLDRPYKVLFIADKWCAGNIAFGLSEWETNLWSSLVSTGIAEVEVFHFDEYVHSTGKPADAAALEKVRSFKPDLVCLVIYKMPGSDKNVPTRETLAYIHGQMNIPIMAIWGDLEIQEQIDISRSILPYVNLNVATASAAAVARIGNDIKYAYTWVPKDTRIFYADQKSFQDIAARDIDVCYIGSPKKDRLEYITFLKNNGISVYAGGGERQEHMTAKQFADTYRRTKIALSFSRAHVSHVVNARPFEAMSCGAMIIEQESFEMPKLYEPFKEYVPYSSKEDLLKKIRYYLNRNDERQRIAEAGWIKTVQSYSTERFWRLSILRTLSPTPQSGPLFEYGGHGQFKDFPFMTSLKLSFLDALCSSMIGFKIYLWSHPSYHFTKLFNRLSRLKPTLEKKLPKGMYASLLKIKAKVW